MVKERNVPLDFYSFHGYMKTPDVVKELSDSAMMTLREAGLIGENGEGPELHYNEWNYVREWVGEQYKYSRKISLRKVGRGVDEMLRRFQIRTGARPLHGQSLRVLRMVFKLYAFIYLCRKKIKSDLINKLPDRKSSQITNKVYLELEIDFVSDLSSAEAELFAYRNNVC